MRSRVLTLLLLLASGCSSTPTADPAAATTRAAPVKAAEPDPRIYGIGFDPGRAAELRELLVMEVREIAGVARRGEIVRNGVPIPRALNLTDPSVLRVLDASGKVVPAEARVLARWNAPKKQSDAPIQWVLLSFPADVEAQASSAYRLSLGGGKVPELPRPLTLTRTGERVVIDTGAAVFTLAGTGALFDEVRLAGQEQPLITGGAMTGRVSKRSVKYAKSRRVRIEHSGPLSAVVVIEGAYDLPETGGGGLAMMRRYVFTAGSPSVRIRQAVSWEGALCGDGVLECGKVNALLVEQLRNTLQLGAAGKRVLLLPERGQALKAELRPRQTAFLRQKLRKDRGAPYAYEASVPGEKPKTGTLATGGVLSVETERGTVAVALDHLHRYEPQALRLLQDGSIALDVADDRVWLGARQGLFAQLAVTVLPGSPPPAQLERTTWAPLNHPLWAWPRADWLAASGAVEQFPVGELPGDLAGYDALIGGTLQRTIGLYDELGAAGLMTYGSFPRNVEELSCRDEITPGQTWDDTYWCGSWTDYHNTSFTAATYAMRTGDVTWIDELTVPAALRMLHTQMIQCAPGDSHPYCGHAPAGYGGFRRDFNSSHQYWENLFFYYWLTGDSTVLPPIERAVKYMRGFVCSSRKTKGGPACKPEEKMPDEWSRVTDRVGAQWNLAYRFAGLAGKDGTLLEDWRANLARAVTQYYLEGKKDGTTYGIWVNEHSGVKTPGAVETAQLWMASLYDMRVLERYALETDDAPLGTPPVRPSQVLAGWMRTLADLAEDEGWPNQLRVRWSPPRIGGTLLSAEGVQGGDDPRLYATGKATLTAVMVRAALRTEDEARLAQGRALTCRALRDASNDPSPLGKTQGIFLTRLHAAVGAMAERDLGCD